MDSKAFDRLKKDKDFNINHNKLKTHLYYYKVEWKPRNDSGERK